MVDGSFRLLYTLYTNDTSCFINMCDHLIPVLNFIKEEYFEDSEEEENPVVEKIDNFAEITVPLMRDHEFKSHFRMNPDTFEDLLKKINSTMDIETKPGYPRTALEKEVMMSIWYLGNIESFRSVANRFGVTKSTCWEALIRIGNLLLKVNDSYKIISFPTRIREQIIAQNLTQHGFQGVIGCIDGCHIEITAPKDNPNSYVNRKGYHSLLLQGICDDRWLFTDVYAGQPGSIHDYNLYKKSDFYAALQEGEIVFHDDFHLIGDLAYKLDTTLMVGFKDNGHLTLREKNYNKILSKIRVNIENAFALLKGRFRKLKFLETVRPDLSALNIMSACILHNICILNGDTYEDLINIEDLLREARERNPEDEEIGENQGDIARRNAAIQKRNNIVNRLPIIPN